MRHVDPMRALRVAIPALALLLLAAHWIRAGGWPLAAATVLSMGLLWVRRRWAARLLQAALAAGTVEWLRTLAAGIALRHAAGQPALRLTLILLAVAALTACGVWLVRPRADDAPADRRSD